MNVNNDKALKCFVVLKMPNDDFYAKMFLYDCVIHFTAPNVKFEANLIKYYSRDLLHLILFKWKI